MTSAGDLSEDSISSCMTALFVAINIFKEIWTPHTFQPVVEVKPERIDPMQAAHPYATKADVWSFGITLMELALGCFPYGKWATIFEQLNAVVNGPPPKLPEDGRFSKMMQEFANACVTRDATARSNYHDLQQYKFFRMYYMAEVDVGMWLKTIIDPIS